MNDRWRARAWREPPDRLLAALTFLTLGAIYLATLLPGLGGTEDSPKFQYVGAALGTPHEPGYPLYMLACWAFSKLPIGTLAYRINLLSAFWGAAAATLVLLAMRRLAVPRTIAFAVAIGAGLGRAFWEHSTFAEAYTQVSAFTAAAFLALIVWEQDGRDRWLFAAVAAASLAFGTHLIVAAMVPAFAGFVLVRRGWHLPLRVVFSVGFIVALGFAQYGYIWIRTVQHAPYLEAQAESLADLVNVLRARQFQGQTFTEPLGVVLRLRVPEVWAAALTEMGPLGVVFTLVGTCALWWQRRRATAGLLACGCLASAALLTLLGGVATDGILLPALMPAWMLAGCGFAFAWSMSRAIVAAPWARAAATSGVVLLAAAVPVLQARDNLAFNDRHDDLRDTTYVNALFQMLHGPSAFVAESYTLDHMLDYQRYTTQRPQTRMRLRRNPDDIAALLRGGWSIYAFTEGATALAGHVRTRSVVLNAPSLDARLQELPDDEVVIVVGTARRWPSLRTLNLGARAPRTGRALVVAVKGQQPLVVRPDFQGTLEWRAGEPLGDTGRRTGMNIRIDASQDDASIAVDGETVVRSRDGLAVVELGERLSADYVLRPGNALRPPLDMSRRPLYRLVDAADARGCPALGGDGWTVLPDIGREGRISGQIAGPHPARPDPSESFNARWLVYLAAEHPLPVRFDSWTGRTEPQITVEAFTPGGDAVRLRARLQADGLVPASGILASPALTRIEVAVDPRDAVSTFRINLGGRAGVGWGHAMVEGAPTFSAVACADQADPLEPDADTRTASVYLGSAGDFYFADAWHNPTPWAAGFSRRAEGPDATVLLPIATPAEITVRLSVESRDGATALVPSLNGRALPMQRLGAGWNDLSWHVGADTWRTGLNELALHVEGGALDDASARPSFTLRRMRLAWPYSPYAY